MTETIDNENSTGAVYVDGKTWTARSADGIVIPVGAARWRSRRMEGRKAAGAEAARQYFRKERRLYKYGWTCSAWIALHHSGGAGADPVLISNIVIVQQSRAYVVERLGAFRTVWNVGLHLKVPFIERVAKKVSLKEQVADFAPQPVITKDNVTMQIDTVIYFQITDPKLYTYGVEHPMNAIENLTATTLRNIIGEMELDQSLTSRDTINAKMRSILDEATDPWGIKVNRVELKNIIPPKEIQNAMEKQMKAERERRESILQAEGQKQSQILVAEGEKQSADSEGGRRQAGCHLEGRGRKGGPHHGRRGRGPGHSAGPAGPGRLLEAARTRPPPTTRWSKLKALETMQKVADGKATKIIIPSELQGLAGLAASAKAVFEAEEPKAE